MSREYDIALKPAEKCTGCGACMTACPVHAISMQEGELGCKYPVVDRQICICCGKCVRVCEGIERKKCSEPLETYAAFSRCDQLVENSASGGIFASLAMSWIRSGGLVAGAVMDCTQQGIRVYHLLSDKESDVRRMQGSKYVQSDAWRCFDDVLCALKSGKQVLFCGTPCQAAALRSLTSNPENLTTVDLICHGVPSAALLEEYLQILSRRFRARIVGFKFRDKRCSKPYCAKIDLKSHGSQTRTIWLRSNDLSYYRYFLDGMIIRENCYSCPFACLNRCADVTIGDYWGIELAHEEELRSGKMPRKAYWSCLLVNSPKGSALLEAHGTEIERYSSRAEWVARQNRQLNMPARKPEKREQLIKHYNESGYKAIEKAFIHESGGRMRYMLRIIRNMYRNQKAQYHENKPD